MAESSVDLSVVVLSLVILEVDELKGCKISGEPEELETILTDLKSGPNSKVLIYIVANGGDSVIKMPYN